MGTTATRIFFNATGDKANVLTDLQLPTEGFVASQQIHVNRQGDAFYLRPVREEDWIARLPSLAISLSRSQIPCLLVSVVDSDELLVAGLVDGKLVDVIATSSCFGDDFEPEAEQRTKQVWTDIAGKSIDRRLIVDRVEKC